MLLPQMFSTETHSLYLQVEASIFMRELEECTKDSRRDLSHIIHMLEPFLTHWKSLLTNPAYPRDIQISALTQCLSTEDHEGSELIKVWIEQVVDLDSEMKYILCETIRSIKYYPHNARPIIVEYIVALFFRNHLKSQIENELELDLISLAHSMEAESTASISVNSFFTQVPETRWDRYLLYLVANGFTACEISTIVKLPRETFYYEERNLWQKLKSP